MHIVYISVSHVVDDLSLYVSFFREGFKDRSFLCLSTEQMLSHVDNTYLTIILL